MKYNLLPTLVPPELHGLIYLTGQFGMGKSTLAATLDRPDNTLFFDFDSGKGSNLNNSLHFGLYLPMLELAAQKNTSYTDLDLFSVIVKQLDAIEQDRFTTCVIDNIAPMEAAFAAEVKRSPATYNCNPANVQAGRYGGANPGVKYLLGRLIAKLQSKGIQTIVVTAHVGGVWLNGVPVPNKFNAKGSMALQEASLLTLALVPGATLTPAAIVIKEAFGKVGYNEDTQEFLPVRTLPTKLPVATMKAIKGYIESPIGLRTATPEEVASEAEISEWMSAKFTSSQLALVEEGMKLLEMGVVGDEGQPVTPPPTQKNGKQPTIKNNDWNTLYVLAEKAKKSDMVKAAAKSGFAAAAEVLELKVIE